MNPNEAASFQAATRELKNIRYALDKSAIVAIADKAGNIVHVNDKFCEISKYSREELIGQNHRLINSSFHPKEFFIDMWQAISHGKIWEGEIKNKTKDGTFYWVYTTIVPFLAEGSSIQYVSIRFEITQWKLAEEQLTSYTERLEISNRELHDFASVAAHDLQEPLRKIQAFADRLSLKYKSALGEEGQDYLSRMFNSARRMQKLIDDLLTYSQVTSRAKPFVRTNLNNVMQEVLADLEVRIEESSAKIRPDSLIFIDADPSQIQQLFQNLLTNAIKFHKKDKPPFIRIKASQNLNELKLEFSDNGIGFDLKYIDRIFTIFQRLHGRHEYEGTGIGLAICRKIVERHHGNITATSTVDQGSTFIVTLPINQNEEQVL